MDTFVIGVCGGSARFVIKFFIQLFVYPFDHQLYLFVHNLQRKNHCGKEDHQKSEYRLGDFALNGLILQGTFRRITRDGCKK